MSNRCHAILAAAMTILLLAACGPAAPTAAPLPTTAIPPTPTVAPSPIPPAATAAPTPAPTSLPPDSRGGGSIALTSDRGDKITADFRAYGGQQNDAAYDILLLADGGTLIAGLTNSTRPSHRITPGNAHLVRTDAEGNILWEKDYGGEDDALFSSLIPVGDDAYVVLGEIAASYERDETDFYLVKVDGEGNEIWSHTYGGRGMDHGKVVRQTADGGFILTGNRADEFPTGNVYEGDIALIKTDAEGNEVWTRTYGEKLLYLPWGVAQTPDGGYVLTGWEAKTIDDRDVIVLKTDAAGEVEWSRSWDLGPGDRDGGFDMILTSDGHIVVACIQSMGSGAPSAVLLKLDLDGNEIWNKLIGEQGVGNTFWHIVEDTDGGYVMAGDTHLGKIPATGADIHGGLIVKTDPDGDVLWQYVVGGGEYEQVVLGSAVVLPAGGYLFVGSVTRGGDTYSDMLWLKLTPDALRITVVYDNTAYDPRLQLAWGFAALIEYRGHTLLFDTGGDPDILMSNMDLLGIDPASIEAVALSHIHGDHVDGLPGLSARGVHPPVYVPPSFPRTFRSRFSDAFELIDVAPGQELSPGIWTTGEMVDPDVGIYEQALVISTTQGLVVVTGCAHPGIVEIVTRAREMGPVHMVLGGFHLAEKSRSEIQAIIDGFRRLGVERAGPTHCTGDTAISMFAEAYGEDLLQAGAGRILVIEGAGGRNRSAELAGVLWIRAVCRAEMIEHSEHYPGGEP